MIGTIRQGLKDDGYTVSISQLCRWFEVPRRTVCYRPTRKPPAVQVRFCQPIKQMIEENPSFGYPYRGAPVELQQEHGSADFPADAMAGEEAPRGLSTSSACHAFCGCCSK